jgi:hypothetical protein
MTCQNLQNKLLNITVLFIWYLLQIVGEFKKNVTRQTWQALFHFGEYLFPPFKMAAVTKNRNCFKWPKLLYFKPECAQI